MIVIFHIVTWCCRNIDSQTIAQCTLQRLSLEASMYGASVVETLHESVTHSICFVPKSIHIPFKSIYRSIQGSGQHETLLCKNVHVVSHLWLQDTIQQKEILSVSDYNLRYESSFFLFIMPLLFWSGFKWIEFLTHTLLCRSDILVDAAFVTKEEPSPKKRQRVSETPESSSRRESLQDSVEDFLRMLLPSLESCTWDIRWLLRYQGVQGTENVVFWYIFKFVSFQSPPRVRYNCEMECVFAMSCRPWF